jgi:DNA-binding PadR family transcriptional regulator
MLLQALLQGPVSDEALRRGILARSRRPTLPELSGGLRDLVAHGLVRCWQEPGPARRRGGRSGFYELTASGVAEAEALLAPRDHDEAAPVSRAEDAAPGIDARLRRSLEISAVAGSLWRPRKAAHRGR